MFELGQTVYLKTDNEQLPNIIVSKVEYVGGTVNYTVGCNGSYTTVYECELTSERDILKTLDIHEKNHTVN